MFAFGGGGVAAAAAASFSLTLSLSLSLFVSLAYLAGLFGRPLAAGAKFFLAG
jgi:hypothetical protein